MKLVQISETSTSVAITSYIWRSATSAWTPVVGKSASQPGTDYCTKAWLGMNLDGDCNDLLVQVRAGPAGKTILNTWRWYSDAIGFESVSSRYPGGTAGLTWLAGDIDGDGAAELVQSREEGSAVAFDVYRWNRTNGGWTIGTSSTPRSSAATLRWFTGDVDGDGAAEVVQVASAGEDLQMAVYGWDSASGQVVVRSPMTTIEPYDPKNSLAWLSGTAMADRRMKVVQVRQNPLQLETFAWSASDKSMKTTDVGLPSPAGASALAWFPGSNGAGATPTVIQLQATPASELAAWVYEGGEVVWHSGNVGERFGGRFIFGDMTCSGRTDLVQLWPRGDRLSLALYQWQPRPGGYKGVQFDASERYDPSATWLTLR